MIIRYISHISKTDNYNWNIGDCFVAQANNQLAFYLYRLGVGDYVSSSLCIDICEYENVILDNMTLFSYDPIRGSYGDRVLLQKLSSLFENDIVKCILEQALEILLFKQESWEVNLLMKIVGCKEGLLWEQKQYLYRERIIEAPINPSHRYEGMPPAYAITSKYNCELGREVRSSAMDDFLLCNWGRYSIYCNNGKVELTHPSFGNKRFDIVRLYNSHIIGLEYDHAGGFNSFLFSVSNRSTAYKIIKNECVNDYHVAFKDNNSVILLHGKTCMNIEAPNMKWDDIIEIHSSSIVVEKNGKLNIVSPQDFNVPPRRLLCDLDEVIWQKEEIYFVCMNKDWRVYNNQDYRISKPYREIRWVTEELICGTDGAGNYSIFNPLINASELLYNGNTPLQFLLGKSKTGLDVRSNQGTPPTVSMIVQTSKERTVSNQPVESESVIDKPMSYLVVGEKASLKVINYMGYKSCIRYKFGKNPYFSKKLLSERYVYFLNNDNKVLSIAHYFKEDLFELLDSYDSPKDITQVLSNRTPLIYIKEILFNDIKAVSFSNLKSAYNYIYETIAKCNILPANRTVVTDAVISFHNGNLNNHKNSVTTEETNDNTSEKTDSTVKKTTDNKTYSNDVDYDKVISLIKKVTKKQSVSKDPITIKKPKKAVKMKSLKSQKHRVRPSLSMGKKVPSSMTNYLRKYGVSSSKICFHDNIECELRPTYVYDSTFFRKKIPVDCNYNYYLSINKDIVIFVPVDTIKKLEESGRYELIGSGKDRKLPQTFGRNVNGKIYDQKVYGTRILVFAIFGPDQYMFYDEVKYLSHRIEKPEPYKNDVIYFTFESVL